MSNRQLRYGVRQARGRPPRRPARAQRTDPAATGTARILRQDPERIEIDVTASGPGYLVLADTFFPGWQATVDRLSAPIHPADLLLRAPLRSRPATRVSSSRTSREALRWGLPSAAEPGCYSRGSQCGRDLDVGP
jgi:hypothetical protein